jgi:predicted dehydrogenase
MAARLGMGVIGLGRRWSRYRQALAALRRDVHVAAVHDQVPARAAAEARQLGCAAAGGVIELLERDDVEAVLLVGGAWFGLWPLDRACQAGKPVLCAGSLVRDDEHADALAGRLNPAVPVHMALWPALELLQVAAQQQVGEALGAVQMIHAGRVSTHDQRDLLGGTAALALLWAMAGLFESAPEAVTVQSVGERTDLASVVLEFPEDRAGQLTLWQGTVEVERTWLDVETDGGSLRAEMPRSLTWHDAEGQHALELPGGLAEVWVVDRFVQAVRGGEVPAFPFERASQALTWLRAARRSRKEGKRVEIEPAGSPGR